MAETPMSSYVVLRQVSSTDAKYPVCWVPIGRGVKARSQQDAIKVAVEGIGIGDGAAAVYVAVPERSWVPVKVQPKAVTTFSFSDAAPAESAVQA